MGVRVVHTHHHRVRSLARSRRPTVVAHVTNDHSAGANAELRAVVLADAQSLDEAKRSAEPGDSFPHIRVDENGDHDGRRDGAVPPHSPSD